MSDFKFDGVENGASSTPVRARVVLGTTASIDEGDLFRIDDGNPGYMKKCADGDTITLTKNRACLCTKASTETAAADGWVEGVTGFGLRVKGTVTTPANLTQAVVDTWVTLDSSGGVQKIDENDTTNGFMRIVQPPEGISGDPGFDTTNGYNTVVVVNEATS